MPERTLEDTLLAYDNALAHISTLCGERLRGQSPLGLPVKNSAVTALMHFNRLLVEFERLRDFEKRTTHYINRLAQGKVEVVVEPGATTTTVQHAIASLLSHAREGEFNRGRDSVKHHIEDAEQLQVQLAGCLTAADGHTKDPATPDQYGWSPAYQAVLELRRAFDRIADGKSPQEMNEFMDEMEEGRGTLHAGPSVSLSEARIIIQNYVSLSEARTVPGGDHAVVLDESFLLNAAKAFLSRFEGLKAVPQAELEAEPFPANPSIDPWEAEYYGEKMAAGAYIKLNNLLEGAKITVASDDMEDRYYEAEDDSNYKLIPMRFDVAHTVQVTKEGYLPWDITYKPLREDEKHMLTVSWQKAHPSAVSVQPERPFEVESRVVNSIARTVPSKSPLRVFTISCLWREDDGEWHMSFSDGDTDDGYRCKEFRYATDVEIIRYEAAMTAKESGGYSMRADLVTLQNHLLGAANAVGSIINNTENLIGE